ncbi:MAG TPA: hypothetical protein VFX33_02340 [Actinomycetales bacterium]|nr:hypothetical protein [Actinomycetales bacterium]
MRIRHRLAAAATAVASLLLGAVLTGTAAAPAHAATCSTDQVTVIVDFAGLGGGVQTGCAPAGGTGLDALRQAGFPYTFHPRFVGLVCTIKSKPDPCNGAPVDAYWSYWHSSGGSWSYSNEGAGTYRPNAGTSEGWAFGAGAAPRAAAAKPTPKPAPEPSSAPPAPAPTAAPKPSSAPKPSALPPAAPKATTAPSTGTAVAVPGRARPQTTAGGASTSTPAGTSTSGLAVSPSVGPTSAAPASTASPGTSESVSAATGSGEQRAAASVAGADEDGGPPTGPIVAGAVLVALAGAGGWQLYRRRKAG